MKYLISGERDGRPNTCGSCRYWSEMLAKSEGGGPMQAYCLRRRADSPLGQQYTTEHQTCAAWASGHWGAVDTPGFEGDEYEGEGVDAP